jgi:hypothetical protein
MYHLLARHSFTKEATWFLNLDSLGAGPVRIAAREGMLVPMAASPTMVAMAVRAMEEQGLEPNLASYHTLPVESAVPLMKGYSALTLMGSLTHWHQQSDTLENSDPNVPVVAAGIASLIIAKLCL